MDDSSPSAPGRFSGEEESVVAYQAISRAALAALLLGLCSGLMLLSPLLVFVPALAAISAIVALRTIRARPSEYVGKAPAIVGLALALLFLGWGGARTFTRPSRLAQQAERFADDWLTLVRRGELYSAHQLYQPPGRRIPVTPRFDDYYRGQPDLLKEYEEFIKSPAIVALTSAGAQAKAELLEVTKFEFDGANEDVVLQYKIDLPASGAGESEIWVTVRRSPAGGDEGSLWQISGISTESPS